MFRFLNIMMLSLLSVTAMAEGVQKSLKVTTSSGEVWYLLADNPKVTFAEGEVVITADGKATVSYALSEHVSISYVDRATDIDNVEALGWAIACEDGRVTVTGAKAGQKVQLYTIGGLLLTQAVADAQGNASLTLDRHAVYVLKIGRVTVKCEM